MLPVLVFGVVLGNTFAAVVGEHQYRKASKTVRRTNTLRSAQERKMRTTSAHAVKQVEDSARVLEQAGGALSRAQKILRTGRAE